MREHQAFGDLQFFKNGERSTAVPAATVSFKITICIRDTIAVER
jgi:hypothetical protein